MNEFPGEARDVLARVRDYRGSSAVRRSDVIALIGTVTILIAGYAASYITLWFGWGFLAFLTIPALVQWLQHKPNMPRQATTRMLVMSATAAAFYTMGANAISQQNASMGAVVFSVLLLVIAIGLMVWYFRAAHQPR